MKEELIRIINTYIENERNLTEALNFLYVFDYSLYDLESKKKTYMKHLQNIGENKLAKIIEKYIDYKKEK